MRHTFISKVSALYKTSPDRVHLSAIIFVTLIIYFRVFSFPFMLGWDDQGIVVNDYTGNGLTLQNIISIFTEFYAGQYAPVNQLYYTVLYSLFGYDPTYYHIGGFVIHVLNTCLVYYLIKQFGLALSNGKRLQPLLAPITAFLFAVAPVNVEPVAWISASKVTLYAFFYLLSIHSYIKYIRRGRYIHYVLALLFFTLSFGSKEQAITLPLCLILVDWLYKRSLFNFKTWGSEIPFFAGSLFFSILTIRSQDVDKASQLANYYPFYQQIVLASYTVSEYLTKCLLPLNLSYVYSFPFQVGDPMPGWLWIFPVAIPLAVFFLKDFFKNRYVLLGSLFFLCHIVLVSNVIPLSRHSITADRYAYVACIGLYFTVAYAVCRLLESQKWKKLAYGGVILCGYFVIYSCAHLSVWQNVVTLKQTIRKEIISRKDYQQWIDQQKNNEKEN